MLSTLLRRILLVQVLTVALLGWLVTRQTEAPNWLAWVGALALPLLGALVATALTAVKSRTPGQPGLWWRSLMFEFWAGLVIFMLRQPWAKTPAVLLPDSTTPVRVPVVLVHGYLCNHRVWDAIAQRLLAAGHPVLAVNLEPLFTSIDRYAPLIEQAVETLRRHTGASQVALVGHSMGGLAIRAWMRAHGHARVARVLTLGTPHAGTQVAPNGRTPNGAQMAWQSQWLQALAQGETPHARSLMRIALTPQDNIVFPQMAQVLDGVPVTVFEGRGHLDLCLDDAVINWVLQELKDLPRAPNPS
jgi:pimeloyl-ACP methyl ester carboxylesterase